MARRLEDDDDTPEEKLEATKWKESWMRPWVRERSVEAAGSGGQTTTGWTMEEGQPRHRQRRPGQWWGMVVLRKRWIRMELMMGAEGPAVAHETTMKSG